MLRAPVLAFLVLVAARAAEAGNGPKGPERWLLEPSDVLSLGAPLMPPGGPPSSSSSAPAPSGGAATDLLSRLIEHCEHDPVGIRPLVTLMPPDPDASRKATLPTLALFARAQGTTIVSLTRVNARADDGQQVVMQRTLVSDLLAGQRYSLTVYEDHAIGDTAARLMGFGTKLTFRPAGWPFRIELLGAYDFSAGASAYLAITSVFSAPPLPTAAGR
jgi:hypothetical protein